jgi:hypothetical protein
VAGNPHLHAWRKQQRARRSHRSFGWLFLAWSIAVALVVLFRQSFLVFLDQAPDRHGEGVEAMLLRLGLLLVGWVAMDVYTAIIRSPDRAVLAILPVDSASVVRFEVSRVAMERWWAVPLFLALLIPVGIESSWWLWMLCVPMLMGNWLLALTASAMVHLLAVEVAEEPRWEGVLDLIRGRNPRAQAAFIYAPAIVLLGCGFVVSGTATVVRSVIAGDLLAGFWFAVPVALALVASLPLNGLAERNWFRATAVLAEIDGRYAQLRDAEEAKRVYLDGLVKWLPASWRPYALRDLRQGWRARRTAVTGAWLLGFAAAAAGWTADPSGPVRATLIAVVSAHLCGVVGVLMAANEPVPLRAWFPVSNQSRRARMVVACAWLQPIVWLPGLSVLFRAGLPSAMLIVVFGELSVLAASLLAIGCGRLHEKGLQAYGPLAALLAGVLAVAAVGSMG